MSSIFMVLVMLGLLVQPAHAGEIGPAPGRFVWYDLAGEAPGRSEPGSIIRSRYWSRLRSSRRRRWLQYRQAPRCRARWARGN